MSCGSVDAARAAGRRLAVGVVDVRHAERDHLHAVAVRGDVGADLVARHERAGQDDPDPALLEDVRGAVAHAGLQAGVGHLLEPERADPITAKTAAAPAAPAPSTASLNAKQLASLAKRSGRDSSRCRSSASGRPMTQVELAFFTSPVSGEMVPGIPIPTVALAATSRSRVPTKSATA